MEFYEVVRNRRAVRKYKPDMVPEEVIYKYSMLPTGHLQG